MAQVSWWDVVTPHADVLSRAGAPGAFAADLAEVVSGSGTAHSDYTDPQHFFRRTYMTGHLRALLADTLQRLAGTGGVEPVVQLATPFGGGKTHTLLALYHLIHHAAQIAADPGVQEILQQAGLTRLPAARIAALVGTSLNRNGRRTAEGIQLRTLWGEIAYQLGGPALYALVREDDEQLTSPGDTKLKALLRQVGPSVLLLDETLPYIEKAATVLVGESTLARQTTVFIQELQQAVTAVEGCAFFYTLPGSEPEQYGDKGQETYRILKQVQQVAGRLESIRVPVQGDDIFEVVRRRLFETLGQPAARERAIEEYVSAYARSRGDLPAEVQSPEYRARLGKAFPFHPKLIEIFFQRWGTLPAFQRTRGILQILAQAVSVLYRQGKAGDLHPSAFLLPGDLPLADPTFRSSLTKFTGAEFETVVAVDIVGSADARAVQIDRELGTEYQQMRYGQGLATAIFLYSFGGGNVQTRGATEAELRLAVTRADSPPIFSEVLTRFQRRMWYLYYEGGLYHFRSVANLNKVLSETEDTVVESARYELFLEQIGKAVSKDKDVFAAIHPAPAETRDVPDTPDLRLVLLPPQFTWLGSQDEATSKRLREFNEKSGLLSRSNKNSLIFLVADATGMQEALRAAQQLLALREVELRFGSGDQLTKAQRLDLAERRKRAEEGFPRIAQQAYRHIVLFGETMTEKTYDRGTGAFAGGSLATKVATQLQGNYQLLEKVDIQQQFSRYPLWPADKEWISYRTLCGYYSQYTYLPRLTNVAAVLKTALVQGVRDGQFGLAAGGEEGRFQRVYREEDATAAFQTYTPETIWLLQHEKALALKPPIPAAVAIPPESGPAPVSSLSETPAKPVAQIKETPAVLGRHTYQQVRFDLQISTDRFADETQAILDVIETLKASAQSLGVTLTIEAGNGNVDDVEQAKEILSQYGIPLKLSQE